MGLTEGQATLALVADARTTVGEGRAHVRFADDGTAPDGPTRGRPGVSLGRPSERGLRRPVAADGAVVSRVDLAVSQVSSCAFGGEDLGDLYITTARGEFGPANLAREPFAGGLFRCRLGVRGMLPVPFAILVGGLAAFSQGRPGTALPAYGHPRRTTTTGRRKWRRSRRSA